MVINTKQGIALVFGLGVYRPEQNVETDSLRLNVAIFSPFRSTI